MRKFVIRILGGFSREEMSKAVETALSAREESFNQRWGKARERLMAGDAQYGVPPLEEYQANGLMTGVE